jgi:transposase InsO family protein
MGSVLVRPFFNATSGQGWPERISTDDDPIFQYHRWKATLRILEIKKIKSLPYVPMSHPFVERLIGSVREELLDQTLFLDCDGSGEHAASLPGVLQQASMPRWARWCYPG